MYLDRIHIRSLKLLKDFELGFTRPGGSPRMWTAVIGKNGTAKTSILQAIALAAAGGKQVNRLAPDIAAHLRDRRGASPLNIEATYRFSPRASAKDLHPRASRPLEPTDRLRSHVTLQRGQTTINAQSAYIDEFGKPIDAAASDLIGAIDDPLDRARAENLAHWFVAGYGIGRFLPDPSLQPRLDQPSIERLEPLFNNRTTLTSLRFIDHFATKKAKGFAEALRNAVTNVAGLVPELVGIELRGRGGVKKAGDLIERDRFEFKVGQASYKFPAVALSHGYQSTLAWIADLLGHVMLEANEVIAAEDIEGVVLVDEIDLYLHPTWQASLVEGLRRTFPKVQFVVTTHSPVVLASLAPDEIVVVDHNPISGDVERFIHDPETGELRPEREGQIADPSQEPDPRTMTGTDLYRTWFGLDRLTLNPKGNVIREYLRLATDPLRSEDEDRRVEELRKELHDEDVEELRPPVARRRP